MTKTILGMPETEFSRRIRCDVFVSGVLCVAAVSLGRWLLSIVSEGTFSLFLWSAILSSILSGWLIYGIWDIRILPCWRLLRLFQGRGTLVEGILIRVKQEERAYGFDCKCLMISSGEGCRMVYGLADVFQEKEGAKLRLKLVRNIAVQWEVLP